MKISELIAELQAVLAVEGDINTYNSGMEAPSLVLSAPNGDDEEADANCGKAYLCIE